MNTKMIAGYLQFLRKSHHYTQEDLAWKLSLSRQAVSKWETGTTIPDLNVLLSLSKLYGITINDILEPQITPQKITDFEQIGTVPKHVLKEILGTFDDTALATALMGASPETNRALKSLFPDIDFETLWRTMGRIRIETVEEMQRQIVAMINLYFADSGS